MGTTHCLFLGLHMPHQAVVFYTTDQWYATLLYPHTLLTSRVVTCETLTIVGCKSLYLATWLENVSHDVCRNTWDGGTSFVISFWVASELAEIWSFQWAWTSISQAQNASFPFQKNSKAPQKSFVGSPFVGSFLSYKDPSCSLCFGTVICHRVWDDP